MDNNSNDTYSKFDYWLSMLANLVTIGVPIVTYFTFKQALLYIVIILLIVTIARNWFITHKLKKIEEKLLSFQRLNQQNVLSASNQITIDNLKRQKDSYKSRLQRIHEDLVEGKISSDILINYYVDEVDSQFVCFEKMEIDAFVNYIKGSRLYDVTYSWNVLGHNPSSDSVLSKLCFIISGDSVIKNNNELKMKIEIKKTNGKWQKINGYISGSDRIKYLNIVLNDYAVSPNRSFNIRFSYIWPRSYVADGGDVFSFGSNTFSSTIPYQMNIKVHADKECFSSAKLQVRNISDEYDSKNHFSELDIIEKDGRNIVTVSLPAVETNRAIYISLAQ